MSRCAVLLLAALFVAGASAQTLYPTLGAAVKSQPNDYKIFAAAVAAANLTAALELSDVTVFIPSDEAFNKTLTALNVSAADILANAELSNILLYHVVPGVAFTSQAELIAARNLTTANGQDLKINSSSTGAVIIGGLTNANVTGFSGLLGNSSANATGSFFTIDFVLVPLPAVSNATNGTNATTPTTTVSRQGNGTLAPTSRPPGNSAASATFSLAALAGLVLAALL